MDARVGVGKRMRWNARENGVIWVDFGNFVSFGFLGVGIAGVGVDLMEYGDKSIKNGGNF